MSDETITVLFSDVPIEVIIGENTVEAARQANIAIAAANEARLTANVLAALASEVISSRDGTLGLLIDGETNALAFAAAAPFEGDAARVGTTPYAGRLRPLLSSGSFPKPKLITNQAGQEVWSRHNFLKNSGDFTQASWTRSNFSPSGSLVEATGSNSQAFATIPFATVARNFSMAVRFQPGETTPADFAYIEINTNAGLIGRAFVNLATGALASNDVSINARLVTPTADETPLHEGEIYLAVNFTLPDYTILYPTVGMTDTDGNTGAATVGTKAYIREPQLNFGTDPHPYFSTQEFIANVPVSYEGGVPRYVVESADVATILAAQLPFAGGSDFAFTIGFYPPAEGLTAKLSFTEDASNFLALFIDESGTVSLTYKSGSADETTLIILGTVEPDSACEIVVSVGADGVCGSLNRELPFHFDRHILSGAGVYKPVSVITPVSVEINQATTGTLGITRFLVTGRALSFASDLPRTFKEQAAHPTIVASAVLNHLFDGLATDPADVDADTPYVDRCVEGAVGTIDDGKGGRGALLNSIWVQRKFNQISEEPGRLLTRDVAWQPGSPIQLTSRTLFHQPALWAGNDGHNQHGAHIIRSYGANKGREYRFFTDQGVADPEGDPESKPRDLYYRTRPSRLSAWAAGKTLVLAAAGSGGDFVVCGPSGGSIEFAEDSAHPNRWGFSWYNFGDGGAPTRGSRFYYTDNEAATFTYSGTTGSGTGDIFGIESTPVLAPNGDILLISRMHSNAAKIWQSMGIYRAANGGSVAPVAEHVLLNTTAAFTGQGGSLASVGHTIGYIGGAATSAAIQLDPDGVYDPTVGVIAILVCTNNPGGTGIERSGLKLYVVAGPDYEILADYDVVSKDRTIGAVSARLLYLEGRQYIAVQAATGIDLATNARTYQQIAMLKIPDWRMGLI